MHRGPAQIVMSDQPSDSRPARSGEPLRDSAENFRLLVESVQDYAIFLLDPDGQVLSWSAGAERLKGYAASEIIGRSFELFYPAEDIERGWPQEELRRAAADGRFEDEGWRLRKDGTRFWASVVITALRDRSGALSGFAKVTRDLSDRRRYEEALRESAEQFRLLVDSVRDYAIFLLDPQGRVLTWNASAEAIKGYPAEEVLHRDYAIFFTEEDVAAGIPQQELATALRDGRSESEGWRVRKDGTTFWAGIVVTPVRDGSGVLRGFAKMTRDLTDPHRLLELERSSRRIDEFLAVLGHELRNPSAAIRNAVEILRLHPQFPAELREVREVIDRQLAQLTRLVDDLLDLGRIASGKILLRRERVDYRDIVSSTAQALRPSIEAAGHRFDVELPRESVFVRGDPVRLAQPLQNLLHNALRYTPSAGRIRLALAVDGGECFTTVTDTGRGIAAGAIERIFDLFTQEGVVVPVSGPARDSGLGIGLHIARTLVEQHGGSLTASSEGPGCGSTFTVRLPVLEPARDEPGAPPAADDDLPSQRILIVDDNRDSADTMAYLLELDGHEVRAAYGAEHALRTAADFLPDVVLLDLAMPDGDGFSVIKRLRSMLAGPVYVAALTGYGAAGDRRSTAAAGFDAHLMKPVYADKLREVLRDASRPARDRAEAP